MYILLIILSFFSLSSSSIFSYSSSVAGGGGIAVDLALKRVMLVISLFMFEVFLLCILDITFCALSPNIMSSQYSGVTIRSNCPGSESVSSPALDLNFKLNSLDISSSIFSSGTTIAPDADVSSVSDSPSEIFIADFPVSDEEISFSSSICNRWKFSRAILTPEAKSSILNLYISNKGEPRSVKRARDSGTPNACGFIIPPFARSKNLSLFSREKKETHACPAERITSPPVR
mmetsp:Transcript_32859/g.38038  ORF Transcript_32859/g.38038 Transcript_32859/m.38038 type:complete len:232 (-) Transcript_32859:129-824(-)